SILSIFRLGPAGRRTVESSWIVAYHTLHLTLSYFVYGVFVSDSRAGGATWLALKKEKKITGQKERDNQFTISSGFWSRNFTFNLLILTVFYLSFIYYSSSYFFFYLFLRSIFYSLYRILMHVFISSFRPSVSIVISSTYSGHIVY